LGANLALAATPMSCDSVHHDASPSEVTTVVAPLSATACAAVTANTQQTGQLSLVSPRTYDTCDKSYVTDFLNVVPGGSYIEAQWADGVLLGQSACVDTEARAVFYKLIGGQWVPLTGENHVVGRWLTGPGIGCRPPTIDFGPIESGASYRIAVSVRQISGGNPTRAFSLTTKSPSMVLSGGCATLFSGDHVRCWGPGTFGELGHANTANVGDDEVTSAAGDVNVGEPAMQISPMTTNNTNHRCAALWTGGVRCWGRADNGRLGYAAGSNAQNIGDDETPASMGYVNVGGFTKQVVVGDAHTCALLSTGAARCWGRGNEGQLGYGNTNTVGVTNTPASVGDVNLGGSTVTQLVAGFEYTCALLSTGGVRCWGRGAEGQLGYGNQQNIGDDEIPAGDVNVGGTVVQLAAGTFHTCALLSMGTVRCWGRGDSGQLGYGNTNNIGDNETPASAGNVNVGGQVIQISAAGLNTCALLATGAVRCWGYGNAGMNGYGNRNNIGDDEMPASAGDVNLGGTVTQISAGAYGNCALLATGAARCWGFGGSLGYGNLNTIGDDETPASAGDVKIWGGCADGTSEQFFTSDLANGCSGSVAYGQRNTLCAPGWSACSAAQWTALRDGNVPTHDYWTSDDLHFSGMSTACSVSRTSGNSCAYPMRVCTPDGMSDPEGNSCGWTNCGLETVTPNQYFGGCQFNPTAGGLCCHNPPYYSYGTYVFDNGTSWGYSGGGDWAQNEFKGGCAANQWTMGVSAAADGSSRAHSVLCSSIPGPKSLTSNLHTLSISSGNDGYGTHVAYDWDPYFYKGECAPNEVVVGLSQTTSAGALSHVRCAPAGASATNCRPLAFPGNNNNQESPGDPQDWAYGYYKAECGKGGAVAGVSRDVVSGAVHAILCCDFSSL
jgi:alpha-tubulin suppressor-like RCC1 family protein